MERKENKSLKKINPFTCFLSICITFHKPWTNEAIMALYNMKLLKEEFFFLRHFLMEWKIMRCVNMYCLVLFVLVFFPFKILRSFWFSRKKKLKSFWCFINELLSMVNIFFIILLLDFQQKTDINDFHKIKADFT